LPAVLRGQLADALAQLEADAVAVRSSSPSEDLSDASLAGQYETVLDVRGLEEVEAAVRRCWASVSSPDVTAYRETHDLNEAPMAVLIQRMVDAEAAGVAFSANPRTGARDEVVINAVNGLSDRFVPGEDSPDEWVVHREKARCEAAPKGAIDEAQAVAIAEMVRLVQYHFGVPQDVEWAIEGDTLYLLQARPITSLPDPPTTPIPIELSIPDGFWMYDASHNPRPGHHMDLLMFPMIRRSSERWAAEFGYLFDGMEWTEVGMWPYQRIVPLGGREGPTLPTWMMWLLVRLVPMLRKRTRRAIEAVRSDIAGRCIGSWYEEWQPELAAAAREHLDLDLTALTDTALTEHTRARQDLLERGIQIHMFLHGTLSMILYELSTACEELLGWDLARTLRLVSGTSYKSTEPARKLHELTRLAAERPAIRALFDQPSTASIDKLDTRDGEFAEAFSAYLDRYGHRALGYTLGEPTLAETPELFLDLIRGQLDNGYDPDEEAKTSAGMRETAIVEARALLATSPNRLSRFERILERAIRAYPIREDNEFFTMSAPLAVLRYAVLEIGRRLAERGVIEQPADVMHLELDQALSSLEGGGDHRSLIDRRRGERAWARAHPGPPFYGDPPDAPPSFDFLPVEARLPMESMMWSLDAIMAAGETAPSTPDGGPCLNGIAASPGRYTGPVRVVMDNSQFDKIQPGDVLVCPITSPVWSVLFPIIRALVTDTGGVLSHPAIIAREYGIPAVVATGAATARLHDGDLVTVDGTTGTVELETPATAIRHAPLQEEDK
ncbi:MAG TPA: PEP/pyruvate-binding domain-containing protein, partial [Acidimicrobiia bacterium]